MALETTPYINGLNPSNPPGSDRVHQGDDHIRLIKAVLKATFPNITGPITLTQDQINGIFGSTVPTGFIGEWFGEAETVPSGWGICNGSSYPRSSGSGTILTPDMRGRVPIGVNAEYTLGSVGGAASYTISTAAAGDHTHTGSTSNAGSHDHGGAVGATALSVSQLPAHWHGMANSSVRNAGLPSEPNCTLAWSNGNDPGEEEYELSSSGNTLAPLGRSGETGTGATHGHTISGAGDHNHPITLNAASGHSHQATFSTVQPSLCLHYIMKL